MHIESVDGARGLRISGLRSRNFSMRAGKHRPDGLDERVPRRLKGELVGHDVKTAPEMGWASKTNGELLALAAGEFDVS